MTIPSLRPGPKQATTEMLVIRSAEEFCGWFLDRTGKWPKSARFTLTQRLENLALDVMDELVQARFRREGRLDRLRTINLHLERMRHLLRLALRNHACSPRVFETSLRRLDEIGRMTHGWRSTEEAGGGRR